MRFLTPATQSCFLCLALIVYGCFSSPTPDGIGIAESVVAILLLLSVRVTFDKADISHTLPFASLAYGLTIPLLMAMVNGQQTGDILRDVVPMLYLFVPLFLGWVGIYHPHRFLWALIMVGIAFSVRTLISYESILMTPSLWGRGPPADLLYLANSPEVLFSALCCLGLGGRLMMSGHTLYGVLLWLLFSVPMIAMALMMQRAGIGVVILYITIALGFVLYHRPKWGAAFIMLLLIVVASLWSIIDPILQMAWHKTEIVGLNARAQEWQAVFNLLTTDWVTILFGEGWGGRIESPAVGGLSVNYTHSLISSLLLKTGLVGTFILLTGCLTPLWGGFKRMMTDKNAFDWLIIGAAIYPFLISVFLYASYKSLGFGLILLVFLIFPIRKLEKIK